MRHVLALVEFGNFHKASRALKISQPALTKSIQQVEHDLGVRLFDRHGKAVAPTAFGEIVSRTAREVIDALDGMTRAIGQVANLEAGELSVGAGSYVADVWLGPVVSRLLRRSPRLGLTLHVDHWDPLAEMLRRGRIDLFVANLEPVQDRPEFRVIPFPGQSAIWIARRGHPLSGRAKPRRSDLAEYPLIGPPVPEFLRRWLDAEKPGTRVPLRKIDILSVGLIKAMVRQGDAISLVHPDMVREELARGHFVIIEFDAPPIQLPVGLAWLADRSLSPAGLAFAREMLAEVGMDPNAALG
ncbi:MAG: LysR family transcriptional regulator [Isosphaeraceae bacterium]